MSFSSLWITGSTRSGKTTRLVEHFTQWIANSRESVSQIPRLRVATPAIMVLAANDDNRRDLTDRLATALRGSYPVVAKTPLGWISDEVMLFWPLLFEKLNLKAQFPIRLRPETEQELATRLWRRDLEEIGLSASGITEYKVVRRTLDLLQLAGASGIVAEEIPLILAQGLPEQENQDLWQKMGQLLLWWRQWCLERGLLSYGLIYELYWRYLLEEPQYQSQLTRRYQRIFADDVDDYPGVTREIFKFLLGKGATATFTYNHDGKVRLGLNADPNYLAGLASYCEQEELNSPPLTTKFPLELRDSLVQLVSNPLALRELPPTIQSLQTVSRSTLLRQTAEVIIKGIADKEVKPQDIAVIAPGLDEIARYSLIEILSHHGIPVAPLNEQRPLISSPLIRALLTLLALVYPGLGRLVDRDSVAQMLVVLSSNNGREDPAIDPVRAGLLADHCYYTDLELPRLLPPESFPRWDRLGNRATDSYKKIRQWLEVTRQQQQKQPLLKAITFLDRAIKEFFASGSYLGYDQLASVCQLMETAQHYWEVDRRLRQHEAISLPVNATVAQFIQLLRRGTITANPRHFSPLGVERQDAVTLATIFQYRSLRRAHRWHFWLDVSSPLWDKSSSTTLFGAPLFLQEWSGKAWLPENEIEADQESLERILRDLLGRVEERLYLCHSDLAVNGNEQIGSLLTLVHSTVATVASTKNLET